MSCANTLLLLTLVPGKRLRERRRWTGGGMWPYTQINVMAGLIRQPVNLKEERKAGGRGATRPPVGGPHHHATSFHLALRPFFGADELPGYCVSGVI